MTTVERFGAVLAVVFALAGCAGMDDYFCRDGLAYRVDGLHGPRCVGFGHGFQWRVEAVRRP